MYEARDKKMSVIVKMEHVTKQFGGLTAVNDFSGEIEKNAIVGLIGPNGAGKTTLFNMIANYYHPTSGKIYFKDQDITEARTEDMARMGLARTFQVTKPFGDMTVLQNIMVGAFLHTTNARQVEQKAREVAGLVGMTCDLDMIANNTTTVDKKKLEIARALAVGPELILLDIMLPGEDGMELLKRLKSSVKTREIPVIMVTAKGAEYDKVMGLDSGADDYVTKPFGMMELVSRVKAVLRRTAKDDYKREDKIALGNIEIDIRKHEVRASGSTVNLTLKEYELLKRLMRNPNIVLTRDQLLEDIWGYDFDGETRTVDVHVRTLRQKLGACGEKIETVRGVGYKMCE